MPNPSIEMTRMPGKARNRSTKAVASSADRRAAAPANPEDREHEAKDEDEDRRPHDLPVPERQ